MTENNYQNTGEIVDPTPQDAPKQHHEPSEAEKALLEFVVEHTDSWREYRDSNFMADFQKYERIWRGIWDSSDKQRDSERSRVISPATQQAIETRHAEIMEAIFGQDEYFEIDGESYDPNAGIPIEKLKNQLKDDFKRDKIRKSFDQIALLAEIYGTGIGEILISKEKQYMPSSVSMGQNQVAYGVSESDRVSVKIAPINPKNFLWDPNGTDVDDCMGVAIEKYTSIHKIAAGIASGKYLNVEVSELYEDNSLEPTQEAQNFEDEKVTLLTYYGLVPRELLSTEQFAKILDEEDDIEEYSDMVEAIVVIANGSVILKAEESPYMMKDRPVLSYQADTVPNRLMGRGTAEKAFNMQSAVDGSMRSHMDALALTVAPMVGIDATRLPRGAKFEVRPGKAFLTNGAPSDIIFPFKFGTNDGAAMQTSKEFERMLTMATGTIDSNGTVSQVARDANMDMATATMIKKYKRVLVNFQEDFLIPFINKAAWRYMQFDPQRYPAMQVKFLPTATLGIIAREYEQKQLAFLIQTLGAQSPLTPILMQSIVKNSSLTNKNEMLAQLAKASQPDPQKQQMQQMVMQLEMQQKQADTQKTQAEAQKAHADAQKSAVEAQLAPDVAKAKIMSAISNNLNEDNEGKDFERRAKIAELMLKEKDIESNQEIAKMQTAATLRKQDHEREYMNSVDSGA